MNKLKILIVEDNEGDYLIIEDLFFEHQIPGVLSRAKSYKDFVALTSNGKGYDLVFLDLSLPDSSGSKLVSDVINNLHLIPVIVLTGYNDRTFGIKTLSLGVADYLLKDELTADQLERSILYALERNKIKLELSGSEERYRSLFHMNPEPMWVYDINTYKFLDVNTAAIMHYGYSREDFLSMTIEDIRPEEDMELLEQGKARAQQAKGISFSGIYSHKKRNGELIQVEIRSNDLGTEPQTRLILAHDITEKTIAEKKIRNSEEALKLLNEQLEVLVENRTAELSEANKQLEAFSYSISHDLQSPLRVITGFAQLLRSESENILDADQLSYLDNVINSSERMSHLIQDLLSFLRAGKAEIREEKVDLNDLVNEVIVDVAGLPEDKISIQINPLPHIHADKAMIYQVFTNLISNAIKYSSKREIQSIQIGYHAAEKELVFFVKDNGAGFDMKYYGRLFGLFSRLHTLDEFDGTGVGLSIVKLIIEKHGGRVWAESEVNKGTTFFFTFPTDYFIVPANKESLLEIA